MTTANPAEVEAKYADRIAKLLTQAESVAGTPEADAFFAKASQLMVEYAISEQMIAAARGLMAPDELVQETFRYRSIYRTGHRKLAIKVATHFGLRVVVGHDEKSKTGPITLPLYVTGFKSDVERMRLLDTSLQLQCATAFSAWWAANKAQCDWMDKGLSFRTRRDFVYGFADGVGFQLSRARTAAVREAKVQEAERAGSTQEEANESVALVLTTRKKQVDDFYDAVWSGRLGKARRSSYASGAGNGYGSGNAAGRSASTSSSSSVTGGRKQLG